MAFEVVKERLNEAEDSVKSYLDSSQEYYKLKGFKFLMRAVTSFSKVFLVGAVALLALFFLSFAASFGIGQILDNTFYGFLCVGLFYLLLSIILYLVRKKLNRPLLKKFSEFYFEDI